MDRLQHYVEMHVEIHVEIHAEIHVDMDIDVIILWRLMPSLHNIVGHWKY